MLAAQDKLDRIWDPYSQDNCMESPFYRSDQKTGGKDAVSISEKNLQAQSKKPLGLVSSAELGT